VAKGKEQGARGKEQGARSEEQRVNMVPELVEGYRSELFASVPELVEGR